MVLKSIFFFRALLVHPDPEIWISGFGYSWSILGPLEVPYTPEKNYTYQDHIWTTTFVTKKF